MFCRNCASEVDEKAAVCLKCGVKPLNSNKFCQSCAQPTTPEQELCIKCGVRLKRASSDPFQGESKRVIAAICGIAIGSFGVHKFILGYKTEGIIMLVVSLTGIGAFIMGPIGLIEGIIYLMKSEEEFEETYIRNKKGWF